jgi:hypothetical protein
MGQVFKSKEFKNFYAPTSQKRFLSIPISGQINMMNQRDLESIATPNTLQYISHHGLQSVNRLTQETPYLLQHDTIESIKRDSDKSKNELYHQISDPASFMIQR